MARTMHAPGGLRRRVIGSVRSEPPRRARLLALPLALAATVFAALLPGGQTSQRSTGGPDREAARATLNVMAGRGELTISGIAQAPPGKVYELWERRTGTPGLLPTDALFAVAHGGRAAVGVPGSVRGLLGLLVTLEPVGGSRVPTGPVLLRLTAPGAGR
jgi:hypothetical protein